jgi:hypothetical protein
MSESRRPPAARDCLDCGVGDGMKLQNSLGTVPTNIPLLYVCAICGCLYTVPPPVSPLSAIRPRPE